MAMSRLIHIYNFQQIDQRLATAGQPQVTQFTDIKDAGYEVVINLASGLTEDDIPQEAHIVTDLGMDYHHIPVNWEAPTTGDFDAFVKILSTNRDKKVFVHCIANYRVSAFVMLYRIIHEDVPLAEARALKEQVWPSHESYPAWDTFIAGVLNPNQDDK